MHLYNNNNIAVFETKNNFNVLADYGLYDNISEDISFNTNDDYITDERMYQCKNNDNKNKKHSTVIIADSMAQGIKGKKLTMLVVPWNYIIINMTKYY